MENLQFTLFRQGLCPKFIPKLVGELSLHSIHRFTAFHHAALTGNIEVVSSLIELESDINVRDHKGI